MNRPFFSSNMEDISRQAFGKYQCCTWHAGQWYSDDDFLGGSGCGPLKWGSLPEPGSTPRLPWRGWIVHGLRVARRPSNVGERR
jgi:hypothetical protein